MPFRNVVSFKNAQLLPTHPNQGPLTSSLWGQIIIIQQGV